MVEGAFLYFSEVVQRGVGLTLRSAEVVQRGVGLYRIRTIFFTSENRLPGSVNDSASNR